MTLFKVIQPLIGRTRFQSLFERSYRLSLHGMNIGTGSDLNTSGEMNVIRLMEQFFPNDEELVIFDVGANVGNYTQQVLNTLSNKAKVFCFEPAEGTYQSLIQNLAQYKNVHAHNFGLGDKEESVTLFSDREGSGLASIYKRRLDHFSRQLNSMEKIELRTLDSFCAEIGLKHLHLLKLDVEGNELNVLLGSRNMIEENCIDLIQFEFGGCNIDSRTFFQDFFYLLNPYYRFYRILKDGFLLINRYAETHEIFITTNYLCVSKKLNNLPI